MPDILGIPPWFAAIAPIAAMVGIVLWWTRPPLRRNGGYRLVLIASVSLAALEAILAMLFLFVLVLFSSTGGMENF